MDDSEPLKTLLDLAQHLNAASARTGRRALMRAMANDPGLQVTERGRTILFTPQQFERTIQALAWRPYMPVRATRTVSAARLGKAARSAQDAFREKIQNLRQRPKQKEAPAAAPAAEKGRAAAYDRQPNRGTDDPAGCGEVAARSRMSPRQEAIERGATRFFTGRPCRHGHVCERFTSNGECVMCHSADHAKWQVEKRDDRNAYLRTWRAKRRAEAADDV